MPGEFDFEVVSNSIGNDLFGGEAEPTSSETLDPIEPESPGTQVEPVAPEVKAEESEAPPAETQEEIPTSSTSAPKTWRKEALAAWETLPQVVKDEVAKREEDMFKGLETYKLGAEIGNNFKACVTPHLDYLQRAGVNVYEEINGLLEYGRIMRYGTQGEKMQVLSAVAQEYNIDLLDLAETAPPLPYTDPAIKALQDEINQLKSGRQQESTQRESDIRAQNQAKIDAFKADSKNEHFDILEPEMAIFIKANPQMSLAEAYEKALWANPLTRAKEVARQTAESKAQSEERIKQAQAAQAANLKTNARQGSATAPTGSMDDTLLDTLKDIRSR